MGSNYIERPDMGHDDVERIITGIKDQLYRVVAKKGTGCFISRHEVLGSLTEEYNEFVEAIHSKNNVSIMDELTDVAIVSIFGLISLEKRIDKVGQA
jgi:hypothetical protein